MTLIEVLLALAIMLLALVGIARLVDIGTDHANEARLIGTGTRLAQSKLAEAEAGAIGLDAPASGEFEEEPGWSWTVEAQQQGAANLYLVTATATRDYRGRRFAVALHQMIVDPAVLGTAAPAEKPAEAATEDTTTGGTTP